MAKKPAQTTENSESTVEETAKVDEAAKSDVWTAEGTLAEQIEKQKLINEGKLKRA